MAPGLQVLLELPLYPESRGGIGDLLGGVEVVLDWLGLGWLVWVAWVAWWLGLVGGLGCLVDRVGGVGM